MPLSVAGTDDDLPVNVDTSADDPAVDVSIRVPPPQTMSPKNATPPSPPVLKNMSTLSMRQHLPVAAVNVADASNADAPNDGLKFINAAAVRMYVAAFTAGDTSNFIASDDVPKICNNQPCNHQKRQLRSRC
jgi:hypothetical protein